ncbi:dihydroorotase [Paenibacillus baekrokdamisoli]|uniref:Dihydroorotase n=1 Tax=Paenibacillus baekrokdamisoli TaxID=1712516 RepID=A0A3G9IQP7_9BACL|nr:dihydroorotase [Paenibacillus baekrokdamisoli]MBB3070183.1 dihydroorotase [Paenibacillus baekrokdamisoli]BBH21190.1 dihydroorotase [Paenibacillus baekrokdamisoli]
MSVWILNGQVWNESTGQVEGKHIRIENGVIAAIVDSAEGTPDTAGHDIVDAQSKLISAGFIDMHVHLREPGFEYKEDIASGTRSAARGGFTTIACMPNTRPVTDKPETVKYILDKAATEGIVKVLPYASITKNELGRELTDFAALKEAGAIGFTDDGVGVQNAQMMKNAMQLAASMGMPVIAHCEDDTLVEGAWASEGKFAQKHGLKGIPNESEAIHVGRDVLLAEATGVHYHVCHVSTEQSVRLIRLAKSIGVKVTAEVCPHHLLLSDEDIPGLDDANWKMNPPLRTPRDVQAVIEGLEDGTLDMIVTDHAPHSAEEKARGVQLAPFGIVGFETAFPLLYTKFVQTGKWTLGFLLQRMTLDPARVFGLSSGKLAVGAPADITVVDIETEREVAPELFASKGKNTPFGGWKLYGWPVWTMVDGSIVWSEL